MEDGLSASVNFALIISSVTTSEEYDRAAFRDVEAMGLCWGLLSGALSDLKALNDILGCVFESDRGCSDSISPGWRAEAGFIERLSTLPSRNLIPLTVVS